MRPSPSLWLTLAPNAISVSAQSLESKQNIRTQNYFIADDSIPDNTAKNNAVRPTASIRSTVKPELLEVFEVSYPNPDEQTAYSVLFIHIYTNI